jgi:hypothetical protein
MKLRYVLVFADSTTVVYNFALIAAKRMGGMIVIVLRLFP